MGGGGGTDERQWYAQRGLKRPKLQQYHAMDRVTPLTRRASQTVGQEPTGGNWQSCRTPVLAIIIHTTRHTVKGKSNPDHAFTIASEGRQTELLRRRLNKENQPEPRES